MRLPRSQRPRNRRRSKRNDTLHSSLRRTLCRTYDSMGQLMDIASGNLGQARRDAGPDSLRVRQQDGHLGRVGREELKDRPSKSGASVVYCAPCFTVPTGITSQSGLCECASVVKVKTNFTNQTSVSLVPIVSVQEAVAVPKKASTASRAELQLAVVARQTRMRIVTTSSRNRRQLH